MRQSERDLLERATARYQQQVRRAGEYLSSHGITEGVAHTLRLGVVAEPLSGHEDYQDMLAIPYITPNGVVDMRFRRLDQGDGPKYLSLPGHSPRLYNTSALLRAGESVSITEGEMDAAVLDYLVGLPAVGVPGASMWKSHYPRVFADFRTVYVWGDGDSAGAEFAKKVVREIGAIMVRVPEGHDVSSLYMAEGVAGVKSRAGLA